MYSYIYIYVIILAILTVQGPLRELSPSRGQSAQQIIIIIVYHYRILHYNIVILQYIIGYYITTIGQSMLFYYNNRTLYSITLILYDAPGLHNKVPAYNIFAKGWVAQKSLLFIGSG